MASTLVAYSVDGVAARLTLDSPHNRNALSSALVAQLHEGLRRAEADPTVRAVVLGHTGNTFCAGADLTEPSEASTGDPADAAAARAVELAAVLRSIVECRVPVIAALDGHVRAGGLGLVGALIMIRPGFSTLDAGILFALGSATAGAAVAILIKRPLRLFN